MDWLDGIPTLGAISLEEGERFCSQSESRPVSTGMYMSGDLSESKRDGSTGANLWCSVNADGEDGVDDSVELSTLISEQHDA
jgi:hypothetical protein